MGNNLECCSDRNARENKMNNRFQRTETNLLIPYLSKSQSDQPEKSLKNEMLDNMRHTYQHPNKKITRLNSNVKSDGSNLSKFKENNNYQTQESMLREISIYSTKSNEIKDTIFISRLNKNNSIISDIKKTHVLTKVNFLKI